MAGSIRYRHRPSDSDADRTHWRYAFPAPRHPRFLIGPTDGREPATIASVTGTAGVNEVVQALRRRAIAVPQLVQSPDALPAAPGFYGWWSRRGALAAMPHIPHPLDEHVSLLYVGISPARETSRQTIRSRVIGNHLNGNIGSSTFRFVLAGLLLEALDLRPCLRGSKVALSQGDNTLLSSWQREHLLLTWHPRQNPWEIEHQVIAQLAPPLNSAGNATHPFYPTVRAARAALRHRASAASPAGSLGG